MIHDWQEISGRVETHHRTFGLITTSMTHILQKSLLKDV
jgi:hypothetical protein